MNTSADWLSIRQASRLLGVHIGTIREWTNNGILTSYRTPGGHRRFSRIALEQFLAQQHQASPHKPNSTAQVLSRVREELRAHSHADWLKQSKEPPAEPDRTRQREIGQRLLTYVIDYVQEPDDRERLLNNGRRVAREYGQMLMAGGISAGSAARATIRFRQLILKTVLELHLGSRTGDEEDARLFQRVSAFLDEILLAIVEAYP